MKTLFSIIGLLLANYCFAQNIYQIRADTVRIYNTCDTAELVLENRTQDTLGFLFNKAKGRTEFRRLQLGRIGTSQLSILGQDTIDLDFSSYGDNRYDLLSTNFVTVQPGNNMLFGQSLVNKVVGYDAYNSPDMPALSSQAVKGIGTKLHYNGLVVRDGSSGFDLAVNWDGELTGPNGAFLRTKDDTQTAWSEWRELLFKDYADTTYAPKNSETLQTVMNRANSTSRDILFTGTAASSPGLAWGYNTDSWRIFVESPQDTPAGDMIFETSDNAQEGWLFRTRNSAGTLTPILNIQPEGTFTFMGNNILHTGNHAAGSAFSQTLTGANVFSTITTNASGHLTQLTTRALTAADIGAAPASTSGNYIQNLSSGTQTAYFSINGTGSAAYFTSTNGTGSNVPHLRLQTGGLNRWVFSMEGTESTGNAGSDLSIGRYNDAGVQIESSLRLQRSTGNLGLGIAAPAEKLHVNGNIISQVTGANSTVIARSASTGDAIVTTDVMGVSASSIRTFRTGGRTGIINNSNEAISILTNGNVGIGTTAPGAKLQVTSGNQAIQFGTGTNTSGYTGSLGVNDDGFNFATNVATRGFNFKNSNGTLMTITNSGKVGINNAAPGSKLDVTGVVRVGMNSGPSDFPATGEGVTISYNGTGYIVAENKTASTLKDLQLQASNIYLLTDAGGVMMNGNVQMDADLNVGNNIIGGGKVDAYGDVSAARYVNKSASLTFTAGASATSILGSGYSVTVTGGNSFMKVTIRTGTSITATGTIGTITFTQAYANMPPAVVWSANDNNAMDAKIGFGSSSVSNLTIFNKATLAPSTTYTYSIMVGGF